VSLSVLTDGASYDLSLLGCLTTGSDCAVGNQLDANFKIAAASLNAQDVVALAFFPITPLDLLEDDGVTDIQGSVTKYSYIGASPDPRAFDVVFAHRGGHSDRATVTALPNVMLRTLQAQRRRMMNKQVLSILATALFPVCAFAHRRRYLD
jgi:hypothetical protein